MVFQLSFAPSRVAKSNTSFAGVKVAMSLWQVTLCNPMRHVSSVAVMVVANLQTAMLHFTYFFTSCHSICHGVMATTPLVEMNFVRLLLCL